ncbi:IPTL-CTERM sorting domain-containing protein [Ottowia thiooxydans]|uniref:IPTL-CTERM sorting domain-containing protein n=1 Tax=Ottowia thiooxydans TaxID=219182 RepID=UPI0003F5232D|nr:IPTL-CTERM sorting domain-containing protein [Ottowia thiooxydans]
MKHKILALASLLLPWTLAQAQTPAQAYIALDGSVSQIRWLDFAGMVGAGPTYAQDFLFDVPPSSGVATKLGLHIERGSLLATYHGNLSAQPLPAYVGSVIGRGSAFGLPLRYQPDTAARKPALRSMGGIMRLNLSQLVLRNSAGHDLQFELFAVDAEETTPISGSDSESIYFTTDGGDWGNPAQLTPVAGNLPATVLAAYPDPKRVVLRSKLPLLPTEYAASAWMHSTVNPSSIIAGLDTEPGSAEQSEAQAVAFGIIPSIPEVSVSCAPATLLDAAGQTATCTVGVTNPPRSAYAIALSLAGDATRFSSDCASVNFAAFQNEASCTITATPNTTRGDGAAPISVSASTNPDDPAWIVRGDPQTVTVQDNDNGAPVAGVTAVPTLSEWTLMALGLLLSVLGVSRMRRG